MARNALVAKSLANYITTVVRIREQWDRDDKAKASESETWRPIEYWFRGHASARWRLKPRLYRVKGPDEVEIQSEFKRRGLQLTSESHLPNDHKEWYFLMQHFGAPTRLLDWTDGALLGLYFALRSQARPRDAAVWMLDPEWLNDGTVKRLDEEHGYLSGVMLAEFKELNPWFPVPFEESLLVADPIAIDPPHVARRVAVQHSHFTVHGKLRNGLDRLVGTRGARLLKITIPKRAVKRIRQDLTTCGITETTVFPDLEALSRELEQKWCRT